MAVLVYVAEDLPATPLSVVDFMLFSGTLSPVVAFGAASASGTAEGLKISKMFCSAKARAFAAEWVFSTEYVDSEAGQT